MKITDKHRRRETDKAMAIGEIEILPKNELAS